MPWFYTLYVCVCGVCVFVCVSLCVSLRARGCGSVAVALCGCGSVWLWLCVAVALCVCVWLCVPPLKQYRGMTDWLRRFMSLSRVSDACQPVSTLPPDTQAMAMALTPHQSPVPATLRCRRVIFTFDVHGRAVQLVALRLLVPSSPADTEANAETGTGATPLAAAYPRQVEAPPHANAAAMLRILPGFSVHALSPPGSIPPRQACSAALSVVPPADVARSKPAMVLRRIIQACVACVECHAPGHTTAEDEPFSFERCVAGGVC